MKQTILETEKNKLIKKFHTLLGVAGINNDGKLAILSEYGVETSKDLSAYQLLEACNNIEKIIDPRRDEMDKARKRLIAAIDSWLVAMNMESNIGKIKAIAERASGGKSFNRILLEQLRSLYYAFTKKKKDLNTVEDLTRENIEILNIMN